MELKHLQALLAIADTGSFSTAAKSIGTVQSNVSAHIARLERELDVQLVDRSSGHLTEEGEVVVGRARRVMNEVDALVADVTALRQEVVGTVRLGMIGTTGRWLVPQLFDLLRLRHPHIHLNVAEGSSLQLELQLASGHLDLAVVTFPLSGDEIMVAQLFNEDLMLVLPRDHPLGKETSIPLERLTDMELLLPAPGTALRAEIDSATGPARVVLRPAMEIDGVRTIASLVFDGYGPAILPATAVPGHLRESFVGIPVEGLPRRRVGVAQRRRGLPSAPVRTVIDVLGQVVHDPLSMPEGIHPV
ncbi:MAG TPA: LysR family transcriptional regulator [Acidimicrobiales bacterium]|nr:LysR family transcriptional regulator [Acidimicrobiales bacterium]